jgi:5-formyltetrahydrofolate cyclo-ligase
MTAEELKLWRKAARERLIAEREGLAAATLEHLRRRIDAHLERAFPGLAAAILAFCWPIRGEYDARPLARRLRERGAVTALPVVIARTQPLVFREWHPGAALASGPLGIPYPVRSDLVGPTVALLPMDGWDEAGYRLGYGAGSFDRTPREPDETARRHRCQLRAGQDEDHPAAKLGHPDGLGRDRARCLPGRPGRLGVSGRTHGWGPSAPASPVCYAEEIDPEYFGERTD